MIVDPRSPPLVIECSYDAADADKDAITRLGAIVRNGNREIKTAVSVHIPQPFRTNASAKDDLIAGAEIRFALYQKANGAARRWPSAGFITGETRDLAALLSAASLPKEEIERVADEVATLVHEAANVLEALPETTKQEIDNRINRGAILKSLKTTMVLWLNALLTQQRLHGQGVTDIPPVHFARQTLPVPSEQIDVWRRILDINWRSIFLPAIEIMEIAGDSDIRATGEALANLTHAVEKIELSGLGLHINVGAELFPKLSEDRKQAAAFYTQASTAELLAALTIRQGDLTAEQWAEPSLFANRSIADLACGTGTLLRAGYRRIQAIHEAYGGTIESTADLHRGAMETGLVGTDISPIAAHLTSASLAAIGQGEPYGETRIGWVNVGGAKDATGALEYFESRELTDLLHSVAGLSTGHGEDGKFSVDVPDDSVDWVLMNPPYSRTRAGQRVFDIAGLSESEITACQRRWRQLIKDEPGNAKAGMASSFLALARKKVRPGGRIGFVLPLTTAFAESWTTIRRMFERDFVDITAVVIAAGQALGKEALSADTGMEEMLLIATRRTQPAQKDERSPVRCVTLATPTTRLGEAGEIARAIAGALDRVGGVGSNCPVIVGDTEIGQVCVFDPGGKGAPWGPLGVMHTGLAVAADNLAHGRVDFLSTSIEPPISMTTLGDLFRVGPTHDLIGHISGNDGRGAFEFFPITGPGDAIGTDRALWAANCKTQRNLVVLPTHKGIPVDGGKHEAMRSRKGRLFYAKGMRWTSQTLLAAMTEHDNMGGRAWAGLNHDDSRVCKAFALWANSTLGMIVHWTRGLRTHPGRSTTDIRLLHQIPCPQLDDLPDAALDLAAAKFDELATRKLSPACQAHVDETRHDIDSAIVRILGLPDGASTTIKELRYLWCREPSVHGRNKQALALLNEGKTIQ